MHDDPSPPKPEPGGFWRSRYALGLLVMGAIAAFFLWSEHRAHFLGVLPLLLLLLACPLMHVFMHRGHGGQGGGHSHRASPPDPQAAPPRSDKTGGPP
jgi:hypothetical protein